MTTKATPTYADVYLKFVISVVYTELANVRFQSAVTMGTIVRWGENKILEQKECVCVFVCVYQNNVVSHHS